MIKKTQHSLMEINKISKSFINFENKKILILNNFKCGNKIAKASGSFRTMLSSHSSSCKSNKVKAQVIKRRNFSLIKRTTFTREPSYILKPLDM